MNIYIPYMNKTQPIEKMRKEGIVMTKKIELDDNEIFKIQSESNHIAEEIKKRVAQLVEKSGMEQTKVAKVLGIKQSYLSKLLKENSGYNFKIHHLIILSKYYNVPLISLFEDKLETPETNKLSNKEICNFIANLLINKKMKFIKCKVENEEKTKPYYREDKYGNEYTFYEVVEEDSEYIGLYFPNYEDYYTTGFANQDERDDYNETVENSGLAKPSNMQINSFFKKSINMVNMYKNNEISEDELSSVINAFINELKE